MNNDVTVRVIPAFGQNADRDHRFHLTSGMAGQNLHPLFNRRVGSDQTDGQAQLFNRFNRGFRHRHIRAEPGGNGNRFDLLAFFTIDHAGMADHRGFDDCRGQLGHRKIT